MEEFVKEAREREKLLSGAKTLFDWRHLRPISPILEALRLMSFMPLTMSMFTGLKSQPRHGRLHVSFRPLSMWELLDQKFYHHLKGAVFTSATLTVEKSFDYIISRLGLDSGSKDRVTTACLDSPFDIDKQVAVISAGYLPSPKTADFETAANQSLETILLSGAKKAMVLFTSHRSLRNSAENLKGALDEAGIDLYFQESSHSNDRVFRRFKAAKQAVLLGTDTFWEGVESPGELLELLILFKLPFTVPDRPWFKANLERIEKNGESALPSSRCRRRW